MAAARLWPAESCSDIANAGTSPTTPSAANEAVIRPVAVLLWRSAVNPAPAPNAAKRLRSAFERRRRRSGPNARMVPLWTMCRPQNAARQRPHQVEENERTHRASIGDSIDALWRSVRPRSHRELYTAAAQHAALAHLLKKMGLAVRKRDKTVLRNWHLQHFTAGR